MQQFLEKGECFTNLPAITFFVLFSERRIYFIWLLLIIPQTKQLWPLGNMFDLGVLREGLLTLYLPL